MASRHFFDILSTNLLVMTPEINVDEPVSLSMAPYTGPWTQQLAAHLLRRTLVGPRFQQIVDATNAGMNASVDALLQIPNIDEPLTYDPDEGVTAFGQTWVNDVYPASDPQPTQNARNRSFYAWMMKRLHTNNDTIAEKMALFWQNHFAAVASGDARATYDYFKLIYDSCLGNYKQLVLDMTVNPNMLLFLNGSSNTLYSPNENYSRELLELYSIGKGPQIGPGDYTNYTEDDILMGARILTGWRVNGIRSSTETMVTSSFDPTLHDNTDKQLSSKFNDVVIQGNVAQEFIDYIDVIFQQDACAYFICRKLYRYFVNYDLTTTVESTVIEEMAQTLLANNYDVLPVMEQLLKSEHFYDISLRGCQIKTPVEHIFTLFNSSEATPNFDLETNYKMYLQMHYSTRLLGQGVPEPPSVGGWPAYYQEPAFSQLWLNATYMKLRHDYSNWFSQYSGPTINGESFKMNCLNLVNGLSQPNDPNQVIDDLVVLYFSKPIDQSEKDALKSILTNGLPDFEWTDQYNDYASDPTNNTLADPVRIRVELVVAQMFRMAQFHTV